MLKATCVLADFFWIQSIAQFFPPVCVNTSLPCYASVQKTDNLLFPGLHIQARFLAVGQRFHGAHNSTDNHGIHDIRVGSLNSPCSIPFLHTLTRGMMINVQFSWIITSTVLSTSSLIILSISSLFLGSCFVVFSPFC